LKDNSLVISKEVTKQAGIIILLNEQTKELKEYAQHKPDCDKHWINTPSGTTPKKTFICNCGLEQALKK